MFELSDESSPRSPHNEKDLSENSDEIHERNVFGGHSHACKRRNLLDPSLVTPVKGLERGSLSSTLQQKAERVSSPQKRTALNKDFESVLSRLEKRKADPRSPQDSRPAMISRDTSLWTASETKPDGRVPLTCDQWRFLILLTELLGIEEWTTEDIIPKIMQRLRRLKDTPKCPHRSCGQASTRHCT